MRIAASSPYTRPSPLILEVARPVATRPYVQDAVPHGQTVILTGLRMTRLEFALVLVSLLGIAVASHFLLVTPLDPVRGARLLAWTSAQLPPIDAQSVPALAASILSVAMGLAMLVAWMARRWPLRYPRYLALRKIAYGSLIALGGGAAAALGFALLQQEPVPGLLPCAIIAAALSLPFLSLSVYCHSLARLRCPECLSVMDIRRVDMDGGVSPLGVDQVFHGRKHCCPECESSVLTGYFRDRIV